MSAGTGNGDTRRRKKWATSLVPGVRTRRESQADAYRAVRRYAEEYAAGMLRFSVVNVWVDERDGRGWQHFERVHLDEDGVSS